MEENKESINELLKIAMNSIKEMTDVNIIVGEKIVCDGVTIIPISKVKSGFVSGGIDQMRKYEYDIKTPFGGGAGGTLTISPVAFLSTANVIVSPGLRITIFSAFLTATL